MKAWLLDRKWYWPQQKELRRNCVWILGFMCFAVSSQSLELRYLRGVLIETLLLFPLLHNLCRKHQFTIKTRKLTLLHRREGRPLHLSEFQRCHPSNVEIGRFLRYPGSENYYDCITVEKTWKTPYSHTVSKSSVCRWEPEVWPAPHGARRVGAVDLEQEERQSVIASVSTACQVTISGVILHLWRDYINSPYWNPLYQIEACLTHWVLSSL